MKRIIARFIWTECFLLCAWCGVAAQAYAAELSVTSRDRAIGVHQQFEAFLFINTKGETINAIEGDLAFPDALVALERVSDGNSLINMWIRRPQADATGRITFSGITPGGFQTAHGKIFSVVFRAKKIGSGALTLRTIKTLLNDGKGTEVANHALPFSFSISEKIHAAPLVLPKDTDLPESFMPEIARDPNIFDGKWFVVFATQDKGSGIDRYVVCEGSKTRCVNAESPHVLENQKLNQPLFVKAIDKNGNERLVALLPHYPLPWYRNSLILGILMGVLAVCFLLRKILWKKFIKSR